MSTRARGDHDRAYLHPWRPKQPGTSSPRRAPQLTWPDDPVDRPASVGGVESHPAPSPPQRQSRAGQRAVVFVVVAALAAAGVASTRPRAAQPAVFPPSPRAWFDAYMAAAVDDPSRVCQTLLAPELAARYRQARPGSCRAFFAGVQDTQVRIRRIVESGGVAVIDARQSRPPRAPWSVVLARRGGGWRAVDLLSGP